jgi:CubicO group peptidase (beta-lactamase class C family)
MRAGPPRFELVLAFAVSAGLVPCGHGQEPGPAPANGPRGAVVAREVEAFADSVLAPHVGTELASACVVVFRRDGVVFQKGYGLARPDRGVPASPEATAYNVGSNSKLVVATAAMQLWEQGRLDLDADVNAYLRDFRLESPYSRPVTTADLLTHTGGIEDRMLGRNAPATDLGVMPLGDYFRRFPPRRVRPAGEQLNYSGSGMALAAHVVEAVAGETFDRYAEQHVFKPLGMTNSSFRQPIPEALLTAQASPPGLPHLIPYPVGGLVATPADMARFLNAHLNGGALGDRRILRPETAAEMHRRHFSPDPQMPAMALGFFEGTVGGRRVLYHEGSRAHISLGCLCPEEEIGFFVVVAGARNEHVAAPVLDDFFVGFFQRFYPAKAAPPGRGTPPSFHRFVGPYRGNEVPKTTVERFFMGVVFAESDAWVTRAADGSLLFHPPMADPIPLAWAGGTLFRGSDGRHDLYLSFREGAGGEVTGMTASMAPLGVFSFSWTPAWASPVPNLVLFLSGILVFLSWVVAASARWLGRVLRRRADDARWPPRARLAHGIATLTAVLALVGPVWFNVWGLQAELAQMTGVPTVFYAIPLSFTAAALVGLILPVFLVRAWRERYWSAATRVHYTLVTLTALGMIPYLYSWNLLGMSV